MPTMPDTGFTAHQYRFAAHIRDPENNPAPTDVEDRRMAIYRDLFYNNVESFLSSTFPVLHELLDEENWHALARDFFASHHCRSPLFLEIPHEFLNYLEQERGERTTDLPFLKELAHYEWVELAISIAETGSPDKSGDVAADEITPASLLDTRPALSPLAWPLRYQYPVHRISPDFVPESPGPQPTYLLVFRNSEDKVEFIELNPVSARLFGMLQEDGTASGRQLLEQIASELQHPQPQVVIDGGRIILEDWRQRGIVKG